jgi:hypothetical protein
MGFWQVSGSVVQSASLVFEGEAMEIGYIVVIGLDSHAREFSSSSSTLASFPMLWFCEVKGPNPICVCLSPIAKCEICLLNHHLQSLPNVWLSAILTSVRHVLFLLSCINVYGGQIL